MDERFYEGLGHAGTLRGAVARYSTRIGSGVRSTGWRGRWTTRTPHGSGPWSPAPGARGSPLTGSSATSSPRGSFARCRASSRNAGPNLPPARVRAGERSLQVRRTSPSAFLYRAHYEERRASRTMATVWTSNRATAPGAEDQPKARPPCSVPMPLPTAQVSGQSTSRFAPTARNSAA